jgi:plastocyanin
MNRALLAAFGAAWVLTATTSYPAELRAVITDQHGRALADAVIVATPLDPKAALHAKPPPDAVDQVDKQFVPYVKAIYVGSKVKFPNRDNIRHQVYSFSQAKKFELPLYAGTDAPPISFDKPGVVVLGCNIHDWMIGYIYVAETPFFAKTEASGSTNLSELPRGDYAVRVWHPNMERPEEETIKRVSLNSDGVTTVEWQLAVKPTPRIPRVSGDASGAYP